MLFYEATEKHKIEFYSKDNQLYVRHNNEIYKALNFLKEKSNLSKIVREELSAFFRKQLSNKVKNLSLLKIVEIFSKDVSPPDIYLKLETDDENSVKNVVSVKFDIKEFEAGLAKFILLDKSFE